MLPEFKYGSYILKRPKEQEKLCEELMSLDWGECLQYFTYYLLGNFNEIRINIKGHKVTSCSALSFDSYSDNVYLCVNRKPIALIDYLKKYRKTPKCLKRL